MAQPAFDLFCRVIDNYGDAAVCWRLARQLAALGHPVRLWLDKFETLSRLLPALNTQMGAQSVEQVEILPWALADQATPPVDGVVIEAFACTLPTTYSAAMKRQNCLWINLEYLSAESWVEGCHGLPSLQANGVPKYFYFPGFTPATGGLLREPDLLVQRAQALQQNRRTRLESLIGPISREIPENARCTLLFSYPNAPFEGLRQALSHQPDPTCLLVAGAVPSALYADGTLQVLSIPFLPQVRFDELLWCCDLNFVRGEDSIVRALWAGAPLVWQIYPQHDAAHLDKLNAWMARAQWPATTQAVLRAWNGHDDAELAQTLSEALQAPNWDAWKTRSRAWSQTLAQQPDLTQSLLGFCQQHRQKR